ncbi:unnamed protein product, partial [Amoebophrya sp. A25]
EASGDAEDAGAVNVQGVRSLRVKVDPDSAGVKERGKSALRGAWKIMARREQQDESP